MREGKQGLTGESEGPEGTSLPDSDCVGIQPCGFQGEKMGAERAEQMCLDVHNLTETSVLNPRPVCQTGREQKTKQTHGGMGFV